MPASFFFDRLRPSSDRVALKFADKPTVTYGELADRVDVPVEAAMSRANSSQLKGFDGLRLAAAGAVILSHAFLLANGTDNALGVYGVFTFFIISGFLLARSLHREASPLTYVVNRTCRIFPGFLFSTLILAFVIGPLFSADGISRMLRPEESLSFLRYSLDTLGEGDLPGVFAYPGAITKSVNGSLWSLKYEAISYVLLLGLWILCRSAKLVAAVIGTLAALTWLSPAVATALPSVAYTLPYFAGGVVAFVLYERFGVSRWVAIASAIGLAVATMWGRQAYAYAVFGPILIVFLGGRSNIGSRITERIGDCSYGLYLYGWPAEQMAKQLTGTDSPWVLLAVALPLAGVMAVVSCHVIEQPVMKHRFAIATTLRSLATRIFRERLPAASHGAKLALALSGLTIVATRETYWYFLQSMGIVLLCVLTTATIVASFTWFKRAEGLSVEAIGK